MTSDIMNSLCEKDGKALARIMPEGRAGDLNQGLMELGATVCVPNGAPRCEICPWGDMCLARAHGTFDRLPVKSKGKPRKIQEKTVLIIRDQDRGDPAAAGRKKACWRVCMNFLMRKDF